MSKVLKSFILLLTFFLLEMLNACQGMLGNIDDQQPGVTPDGSIITFDGGQPIVSTQEDCDFYDNNYNGEVDEGCPCAFGAEQKCYPGTPGTEEVGICKWGTQKCAGNNEFASWGPCQGAVTPQTEICDNLIDEDCDGVVTCPDCTPGDKQTCYSGPPNTSGVGMCKEGERICLPEGHWGPCENQVLPSIEICENNSDENCDGKTECPEIDWPIVAAGDCVYLSCPASHPYPVGCAVWMVGDDYRGCIANQPNTPDVYFQEGDKCKRGGLVGTLKCSKTKGNGLNGTNCFILDLNKTVRTYPSDPSGCPTIVD